MTRRVGAADSSAAVGSAAGGNSRPGVLPRTEFMTMLLRDSNTMTASSTSSRTLPLRRTLGAAVGFERRMKTRGKIDEMLFPEQPHCPGDWQSHCFTRSADVKSRLMPPNLL